jgi:cysteine desulfurase
MTGRVYLDWNATAPLRSDARAAMAAACEVAGNPSSVHAEGRSARALIEEAREQVAALVAAEPRNVVFTSGGTEANALALSPRTRTGTGAEPGQARPLAAADRPVPLLVSAIEHPSVLAGGRFASTAVEKIPVTPDGIVDIPALRRRLAASPGHCLVSVMAANNETGVVQPVSQVARLTHEAGGLLHVDAVQAAGKIPCDINALGADLLTISAHKLGGPKGIGALVRRDFALDLDPLITGGGQERGIRGGTENVVGIAGFGAAARSAMLGLLLATERMRSLRDRLEFGLCSASSNVVIFGAQAERLPNTTLFAVPGLKAETAVIAFDLDGVAVSSGAACSSGKVAASHVLAAMGVPAALARGAIRVSLGPTTTEAEVDRFLAAWRKLFQSLTKSQEIAA